MSDDLAKRLRETTHMYQVDCELKMKCADRIEELETLIKDFFILLDKTEETDDGRVFHPNHISSCRVEDGQKLENLLRLLKAAVEGRW